MPLIMLGEYRNQNSNRSYPFADGASLLDTSGVALPVDFIIDAFLFPLDIAGGVYLHSINTATGQVYFAADGVSEPFGVAQYTGASDTAYVYETAISGRQIGVVVFGSSVSSVIAGNIVRVFSYAATALCPTAFIPMNQPGVRGILLDDGTLLTGDVVFKGGPGVEITSYGSTVVFDMYGTLPPTPDECGDPNPVIKQICFKRMPGSVFAIASYDGGIALSGYGFAQDDICQPQRELRLPDADGALPPRSVTGDPCNPVPPPDPPDPGPEEEICVTVALLPGGVVKIVTPSGLSMLNPVYVMGVQALFGQSSFVQIRPVESVTEVSEQIDRFIDPPASSDAIEIGIKGLSLYQRGTP